MSVDELRRAVLDRAKSEAEAIIRRAENEATKIIEEATRRKRIIIDQKKEEILRSINPDARIAEARSKARLLIAEAKNVILNEIRNLVEDFLRTLPRDKRLESIKKLASEAMEELLRTVNKVDYVVIKVSASDTELSDYIKSYVEKNYGVRVEGVYGTDILGGVIVECFGGEVAVDNSYDRRLEKAIKTIVPQLLTSER